MFRTFSFKGGIHPPSHKSLTASLPVEPLPPPKIVYIPLLQHTGTPAQVVAQRGDRVKIGQLIAEAQGVQSANVHSSVSGTVLSIGSFPHTSGFSSTAVEIENDGRDEKLAPQPFAKSWKEAAHQELIQKFVECGIVGLGGEPVPIQCKFSLLSSSSVDTLIINGMESDPDVTADHRLILEKPGDVLTGALMLRKVLDAKKTVIAIADRNPDQATALGEAMAADPQYGELTLAKVKNKYPQGHEGLLIKAITGREPSSGSIVFNVATAAAVCAAVLQGTPVYERIITVSGPIVQKPGNLLVRIGTPLRTVLDYCGVLHNRTKKVIAGGIMTGIAQADLDAPVMKSTCAVLAYEKLTPAVRSYPCIGCGMCAKICPMHLAPSILAKLVSKSRYQEAAARYIEQCIECGSCAFVCPAKINLTHLMKLGKHHAAPVKTDMHNPVPSATDHSSALAAQLPSAEKIS